MADGAGEKTPVLLVDGHSIVFSTPKLGARHRGNLAAARRELVSRLARYQDCSGVQVVIVFDSPRSRPVSASASESDRGLSPSEPKVLYAAAGETADDVIERLVARFHKNYDLRVATRDRAEIDAVSSHGAHVLSPEALWDLVAAEERRFQARLDRLLGRD